MHCLLIRIPDLVCVCACVCEMKGGVVTILIVEHINERKGEQKRSSSPSSLIPSGDCRDGKRGGRGGLGGWSVAAH